MATRPILETFAHIRQGYFLDEAAEKLQDVVRQVDATGKPGKLVIEIAIKKATRGGAMTIIDKISTKLPAEQPLETLLFATVDGNLVTDDPHQQKLDLKVVSQANNKELKTL